MEQEGERPQFLPPTADPPDYRRAPLTPPAPRAPAPRPAPTQAPNPPPPAQPPPVPGRNYSAADPGLPAARSDETARPPAVAEPSNPLAVWAISLGVLGLLIFLFALGALVVNLPLSIAAWVTGAKARERPGQASMAQAGMITGMVGTALGAIAIVVWGVGIALST